MFLRKSVVACIEVNLKMAINERYIDAFEYLKYVDLLNTFMKLKLISSIERAHIVSAIGEYVEWDIEEEGI